VNGVITHYLVIYYTTGPVSITTIAPPTQPIISDYLQALIENGVLIADIFDNFDSSSLDEILLTPVAQLCDLLFQNSSIYDQYNNISDISSIGQSQFVLHLNISEVISDWLFLTETTIGTLCGELLLAVRTLIIADQGKQL